MRHKSLLAYLLKLNCRIDEAAWVNLKMKYLSDHYFMQTTYDTDTGNYDPNLGLISIPSPTRQQQQLIIIIR